MKSKVTILIAGFALLFGISGISAQQLSDPVLLSKYGPQYEEILRKAEGDQNFLTRAQSEFQSMKDVSNVDRFMMKQKLFVDYTGRVESEPNNFFNSADNIDDVLAMTGIMNEDYTGRLVSGSFTAGDIDVYEFTMDTTMMYYFAGLHGFDEAGEEMDVQMRLFHESDLDTNVVSDFKGIDGNDQIKGDILGDDTDGRGGAGLFRLTGYTSPIDPATGKQLTGKFYLWVFNEDGKVGTYNMTAYAIPLADWVDKSEPNYPFLNLASNVTNPFQFLPLDGVARSFMLYAPDTVKYQHPESELPTQSNGTYDNLLSEGDEDIDLFFINYKANHHLVIETLPYFGYYRENDGSPKMGSTRLSDPRIRLYDGGFETILFEDDDGGDERMDGPNNIHSEIKASPAELAEKGVTTDGALVFWMGAWASKTRSPSQSVNNSDPGRMMYKVFAYQYSDDPVEVEPNNSTETATVIAARTDTVANGSFADASDVDMYRVYLNEVRMYTIFTANVATGANVDVKIYHEEANGPDNTITLSNDLVAEQSLEVVREGNNFMIPGFVPEKSGAYLIELSSSAAGDYQLGVADKGEIFFGRIAHESDNTMAEAAEQDPIQVGAGAPAVNGMIYPAGDVDVYQFTTGAEVNISIRSNTADLVADFSGKLTLTDDAGTELASSTTGALSYAPTAEGTFYVHVEAAEENGVGFYILSGGEPFEEKEPNNTAAEATEFAIGELYEAELTAGDTDFFKATLKAGSLYSFRSVDNETGGDLTVEFLDAPDGTTLMDDSGWPGNYDGNFKIANIMPTETKTYYIKVSGGAGKYKILSKENPLFEELKTKHEPDNSMEQADALGTVIADGLDKMYVQYAADSARFYGDLDYFRVELVAGQTFVAETKPVPGITAASSDPNLWNKDTDTKIRLFDASGNELDSDDDGGNSWYSKIEATVPATGVYYVQVANSRGEGGGDDRSMRRGDYLLNLSASFAEAEPNNTNDQATMLADRSFVEASFADTNDVDVFKVELDASRIYHFRTLKESDMEIEVEMYAEGSDVNLLADGSSFNTRYSGDNVKINFIPETSGTYYLVFNAPSNGAEEAYNVYMKSNEIAALKDVNEPNDTISDAAVNSMIPSDGQFRSYMLYDANVVGFHDDRDYYGVVAAAGDTIVGETAPHDGDLWPRDFDAYMYLFDENGNELDTNDDGGQDWHSKITYEVPTDGTYYFLVIGQDAYSAPRNDDSNRIRDPARGEYKFALTRTNGGIINSNEELTKVLEYKLDQNYPNPFNPSTTIRYQIANPSQVTLEVFNILGQKVSTLVNTKQQAGVHQVRFDAAALSSGMYIYRLTAGDFVQTQKMLLIK